MAEITITAQVIKRQDDGLSPTYRTTVSTSDQFFVKNDGRVLLYCRKGANSTVDLKVFTPGTVDGKAIADRTSDIATNTSRIFGPYPPEIYNDDQGRLSFEFDGNTQNFSILALQY